MSVPQYRSEEQAVHQTLLALEFVYFRERMVYVQTAEDGSVVRLIRQQALTFDNAARALGAPVFNQSVSPISRKVHLDLSQALMAHAIVFEEIANVSRANVL